MIVSELARRGSNVVYGGGSLGLMGVLADAALEGGGEVTGVIPRFLDDREISHNGVTDLRVVETMHERKMLMADLADAFLVLPGGIGTLEEVIEMLSWSQLGLHRKPIGLFRCRWLLGSAGVAARSHDGRAVRGPGSPQAVVVVLGSDRAAGRYGGLGGAEAVAALVDG